MSEISREVLILNTEVLILDKVLKFSFVETRSRCNFYVNFDEHRKYSEK